MKGRWRRTQLAGVAVAGALTITATMGSSASAAGSAGAQAAAFNNGTGSAFAESMRVDPVAGGLSFGVGVGQALAGHQNTVASADSRALNLGVIGVSLAGQGCDGGDATLPADQQPQPVTARTGDEGADTGKTGTESFAGGQITKFARANADPFAEAVTTSAPIDIPGLVSISGTRSTSHSGVVGGNEREAFASTDIDSISFAGGAVQIGGIHTEVTHRSGGNNDVATGGFSIASATIAGVPVPIDSDNAKTIDQLNAALQPLGFEIHAPNFHLAQAGNTTIAVVDPMSIGIVPSTLRDGIVGPILGAAQPVRQSVFNALIQADCSNSTYITVVDVVLDALSAGGRLALEFGGVNATTGEINQFQFGTRPGTSANPPGVLPASGVTGTGTASGGTGTATSARPTTPAAATGSGATAAPTQRPTTIAAVPAAQTFVGERGGLMAAVAGGGLLLMLASAEGDRRKMRRAQREIPFEV